MIELTSLARPYAKAIFSAALEVGAMDSVANELNLLGQALHTDKINDIIDNPELVGQKLKSSMANVRDYRKSEGDAYYFNWTLKIDNDFQQPFAPTHENMASLDLHLDQPKQLLAANLRRAFSGIVAGLSLIHI